MLAQHPHPVEAAGEPDASARDAERRGHARGSSVDPGLWRRPARVPAAVRASRWAAGGCLAALLLALSGCKTTELGLGLDQATALASGVLQMGANYPSFTDGDELRMAQENAQEFESQAPVRDDPLLENYLTDITQRLVAVANPRPFPYRVRIVNDPGINAFTFGGGLLYVNAGLIARMDNEAQLAMVLAHEIAHVTERHIPRGIEGNYGMQALGQLAAATASTTGVLPRAALETGYHYVMNAALSGHSRGHEREADEVGLEYFVKAGYDPREAPGAFEQLLKEYGDPPALKHFFYGSHPTNRARMAYLTDLVETKYKDRSGGARIVNTDEFQRRTRDLVVAVGRYDYEQNRYGTAAAGCPRSRASSAKRSTSSSTVNFENVVRVMA
jgi:beta-barrel assembly-enhancing protease